MAKLTAKQRKFVEAYCLHLNGARAAREAGYSEKTAESQASRLLRNVNISSEIAARIGKAAQKAEIRLDEIMGELKKLAFSNMSDFCTWNSRSLVLKASATLPPELLAAVESVAETSDKDGGKLMKIKLHSKLQAINSILKLYELSEIEARLAVLEEKAGLK